MAKRLIYAEDALENIDRDRGFMSDVGRIHARNAVKEAPTVEQKMGRYTSHEVAEILAEAFGDACACNFNGNDEWLPEKCELLSACPHPVGVACWEQYLKFREAKEAQEDGN